MNLIICPGMHSSELTQSFIENLQLENHFDLLVFPTEKYPAYSAIHLYQWLESHQLGSEIILIAFSAGVVGAFGAALFWQTRGGKVKALIAIDGWGVPLIGNFPIYRISHDYFTHWSSALLGGGKEGFYCQPGVRHLDLWRSPQSSWGWQAIGSGLKIRRSVADYVRSLLR